MNQFPKVAIIYLSFYSEPYMDDVVSSLSKITYPKDRVELVIVDNPHPTHGSSVRYIEETVMPLSGKEIPHVTLLPQETNLGFSGGNNVGIKWAMDNGFQYIYLHNNDGFVAANFLEPLVAAMEQNSDIGAAQSVMILHPETNLYNSTGNVLQYLGVGYCGNLRVPVGSITLPPIKEIAYASGAAVMMRADLLKKFGLWDEDFFLYHEDIEYSLRLRAAGYKVVAVADSIFYHKYTFGRNADKFYYIERNRLGVLLMFLRWPTLVLILPPIILLELGMLLFAAKNGWFGEKIKVYKYWLKSSSWKLWLGKSNNIFKIRVVTDRHLLSICTGVIKFEEKSINNPLLKYIGNPILALYWFLLRRIIYW